MIKHTEIKFSETHAEEVVPVIPFTDQPYFSITESFWNGSFEAGDTVIGVPQNGKIVWVSNLDNEKP